MVTKNTFELLTLGYTVFHLNVIIYLLFHTPLIPMKGRVSTCHTEEEFYI